VILGHASTSLTFCPDPAQRLDRRLVPAKREKPTVQPTLDMAEIRTNAPQLMPGRTGGSYWFPKSRSKAAAKLSSPNST
jgi:hypothetical protein